MESGSLAAGCGACSIAARSRGHKTMWPQFLLLKTPTSRRLQKSGPTHGESARLWVSVDQPRFPTREGGLVHKLVAAAAATAAAAVATTVTAAVATAAARAAGVTFTGTCLHTQCGTQRVTV